MKPISIIMSAYNEPLDWLEKSIVSILEQTFTDFEFVIVNDNPDRGDIRDLLEQYRGGDRRIKIIANDKNLGLTKSLNNAIKAADGKYIARMDADDVALPRRLATQYEFLEKNDDVFLVGTAVNIINEDGEVRHSAVKRSRHAEIVQDMFRGRLALYHPTIMFRNQGLLYREHFETAQDCDLYLNLLSNGKRFANLRDILLHYRVSNRSISMNSKRKQILAGKLALKFYFERLKTGTDSYDRLDFNGEQCLLKFCGVTAEQLEREALRKTIVFALAAGDVEAAREAFDNYRKSSRPSAGLFAFWLFVRFPRLHRLYRKFRYEVFKF